MREEIQKKISELEQKIKELVELRRFLIDIQQTWQELEFPDEGNHSVCPLIEMAKTQKDINGGRRYERGSGDIRVFSNGIEFLAPRIGNGLISLGSQW